MTVRPATRDDVLSIGRVAEASHWETYVGLLKPDTIGRLLQRDYSPSALRRRLLGDCVVVAEEDGLVVGFAVAEVCDAHLAVRAIFTEPSRRRGGIGAGMMSAIWSGYPELPVCADVLLGNLDGERFYEALGFAPGEIINGRLFDEDVVERRWWLVPG